MTDDLDGVVADPEHHRVVLENDLVRVLETVIQPGETTPIHTHRPPQVMVVLSPSSFIRRDDQGSILLDRRLDPDATPEPVIWSPTLGRHSIENTGTAALVVIGVELKRAASGD